MTKIKEETKSAKASWSRPLNLANSSYPKKFLKKKANSSYTNGSNITINKTISLSVLMFLST